MIQYFILYRHLGSLNIVEVYQKVLGNAEGKRLS